MIKRSIYCLFFLLGVFYDGNVVAQNIDVEKATVDNVEWNEGSVTLSDGTKLSGLLKLNTKTGILGYENGATSKSFTPRNILAFTYFDALENKYRNFLSISYNDLKLKNGAAKKNREKAYSGIGVPQFFEVLVECKTLALISTIGRLNIKQRGYQGQRAYQGNAAFEATGVEPVIAPSTVYLHNETLLILTDDGTVEVVLDITNKEVDSDLFFDRKKSSGDLDKKVLEEYTSPFFDQLEAYAKERKLKFKDREDLITIFEYYKTLSAE